MHTLELINVNSGYNKKEVLHDISFTAKESAIYVVLGSNGAGKTTLFRSISGVLQPYSGEVLLDSEDIASSKNVRNRINYLSHNNAIPEEMTVYNALEFWSNMEGRGNVEEIIAQLNLQRLVDKKFSELSQGQKKRISIASVFLKDGDLYLLDEPTSSLDPVFSKEIRDILLRMSKDKIVLYSSHNLYEASDIGTNLILIKNGKIAYFDKISNIKSKLYKIGIKASVDISKYFDAKLVEGGYYTLTVTTREEAARILMKLIENGILVYEMRRLDNPLQELFESED